MNFFSAFKKTTRDSQKSSHDMHKVMQHVDAQIGRAVTRLSER